MSYSWGYGNLGQEARSSSLASLRKPSGCVCRPFDPCGTKPTPVLPEGKIWCVSGCLSETRVARCQSKVRTVAVPSVGIAQSAMLQVREQLENDYCKPGMCPGDIARRQQAAARSLSTRGSIASNKRIKRFMVGIVCAGIFLAFATR